MARPSVTVEVAFGTDPLTVPGTWTDITAYVRSVDIRRGKAHELSRTQAGEATLTLRNTDRRFDPTNASGPYFPNLRPMRQIRIRATHLAVTYDLFYGFVEDWSQTWPGRPIEAGGDAECQVRAVDAFGLLSLIDAGTAYSEEVLADEPVGYWRLDGRDLDLSLVEEGVKEGRRRKRSLRKRRVRRASFTNTAENEGSASDADLLFTGPSELGSTLTPFTVGDQTTADFQAVDGAGARTSGAPEELQIVDDLTIEFWLRPNLTGTAQTVLGTADSGGSGTARFRLLVGSGNNFVFGHDASSGFISTSLQTQPAVNAWHHYAITRSFGSRLDVYVDGVRVETVTMSAKAKTAGPDSPFHLGNVTSGLIPLDAQMAHVAIYDKVLSAERIAAHYGNRTFDTFAEKLSGTHLGYTLDAIGWPAGQRDIDAGMSTIAQQAPDGSAIDYMLAVAEDTERGMLHVAGDGKVTFLDRHSENSAPRNTSQVTFGEDGAEIAYTDVRVRYDDQDIYSLVEVAPAEAGSAQASDATSRTRYGPRTLELSTQLASENEATAMAQGLLGRYKDERLRIEGLDLRGGQSTDARYTQMLSRKLGDRVTVQRKPPGGGEISADLFIEGIRHRWSAVGTWETQFDFVPAPPVQFWLLGDATHGDQLGTDTILGW